MRKVLAALAALALLAAALSPVPATGRKVAYRRAWSTTLSPAVGGIALAQVRFPHAHAKRLRRSSLAVGASAPFADDYMVAGLVQGLAGRFPRLLVLVANRPTGLEDPAHLALSVQAPVAFGRPLILRARDPLTQPPPASVTTCAAPCRARKPASPCELPLRRRPLSVSGVQVLGARGAPLPGFSPAAALVQAYEAVCEGRYDADFKRAVEEGPALSGPPPPAPAEPVPQPPGCVPCEPAPGRACPLVRPSLCTGEPRAAAGAAGAH